MATPILSSGCSPVRSSMTCAASACVRQLAFGIERAVVSTAHARRPGAVPGTPVRRPARAASACTRANGRVHRATRAAISQTAAWIARERSAGGSRKKVSTRCMDSTVSG